MKILLTGSTGFLGSVLLSELLKEQFEIRCTSRTPKENTENIEYIIGDLTCSKFCEKAINGCDIVIHCAGEKKQPHLYISGNIVTTKNLVNAANANQVKKFIYVSSVGVYGHKKDNIINEESPCNPSNAYEKSKYDAEKYVTDKGKIAEHYIARPTNVYNKNTLRNLIEMPLFKKILKGNEKSNLVYVDDVAKSIIFMVNNTLENNIYNISADDIENLTFNGIFKCAHKKNIFSLPIMFVHITRLLKNGYSNLGNKTYTAQRLTKQGFTPSSNIKTLLNTLNKE